MKLFIDYKTTKEPWGGINTFFRNFIECSEEFSDIITLVDDYRLADVILFGANSRGIKTKISLEDVRTYGQSKAKVFHRLDGMRQGFDSFVKSTEKYIDGYIFQSKKGLQDYSFVKKPSVVIHNGVNQALYRSKATTWLPDNKLKCLLISWSNSLDKGFREFSIVSKANSKVKCTFVGRWPESLQKEYVNVIDPISNNSLPEIYRDHDVLIFPSKLESCSNVVLEALSSGLPVVYYKGSGVEEIVGEKYGIPISDFSDTRTFLSILQRSYNKLIANIERGRKQFSMERTIEDYVKFFYEVESR
jgi:glycosyltransferase involved in cell wall biosynthesis